MMDTDSALLEPEPLLDLFGAPVSGRSARRAATGAARRAVLGRARGAGPNPARGGA